MSGDGSNSPPAITGLVDWFDAGNPNPHVPCTELWRKSVWLLAPAFGAQLAAQRSVASLRAGYLLTASLSRQLQTVGGWRNRGDGVHQYYRRRQQPRCQILYRSKPLAKLRRDRNKRLPPPIQNMDQLVPSEQYGMQALAVCRWW